jgi:hypothetical protein
MAAAPSATPAPSTPAAAIEDTATVTLTPTKAATPTVEVTPTATQLDVALAPRSPEEGFTQAEVDEGAGQPGNAENLMTILSVGAGVAYLSFGFFVVVLAGLYVFARLR